MLMFNTPAGRQVCGTQRYLGVTGLDYTNPPSPTPRPRWRSQPVLT